MVLPDAAKPAPEVSGNRPRNISSLAASDVSRHNEITKNSQVKIDPSITCSSMRSSAIREETEIELDRLQVKLLTAKAFSRDGLDADADEILREVWRALRVIITPLRNELRVLRERSR